MLHKVLFVARNRIAGKVAYGHSGGGSLPGSQTTRATLSSRLDAGYSAGICNVIRQRSYV